MIRNNTNHGSGIVDKNTKLVFGWLKNEGIFPDQINGKTVILDYIDYDLIDIVLNNAIEFNKKLAALTTNTDSVNSST